jgi:hypothetical protein
MKPASGRRGRPSLRSALAVTVGACLAMLLLPGPAHADASVTFTGSLDDRPLSSIDANAPHELDPDRGTLVTVEVRNDGDQAVEVRSVRLSATVLGLSFVNYATRVDLVVEPGETGTRTFALDLSDLAGQARGLLPGAVELVGADRQVLATQDLALDVRGDLRSVYGVFGLGIGAITTLLFLSLLVRLGAGRLPANRWSRAWRFAVPGVGLGLTASLTLSVLRVVLPSRTASVALVVAGVLVGLAVGYLTPAPDDGTGREDLYEEDFEKTPVPAGAARAAEGIGGLHFAPQQPTAGPVPAAPAPSGSTAAAPATLRPGPGPARPTQ